MWTLWKNENAWIAGNWYRVVQPIAIATKLFCFHVDVTELEPVSLENNTETGYSACHTARTVRMKTAHVWPIRDDDVDHNISPRNILLRWYIGRRVNGMPAPTTKVITFIGFYCFAQDNSHVYFIRAGSISYCKHLHCFPNIRPEFDTPNVSLSLRRFWAEFPWSDGCRLLRADPVPRCL